jgi:hypothetical protein
MRRSEGYIFRPWSDARRSGPEPGCRLLYGVNVPTPLWWQIEPTVRRFRAKHSADATTLLIRWAVLLSRSGYSGVDWLEATAFAMEVERTRETADRA